jgi:hypothetical protein
VSEGGKLTPKTAEKLRAFAEEHAPDLADDKTRMRKDIYNEAVGMAKSRGKLSDGEANELAKIQKFLDLRDDQVEKTKFDLARLRTVTEIRAGRLPAVSANNAALRGAPLDPGEIAHYALQVDIQDRPSAGGAPRGAGEMGHALHGQLRARAIAAGGRREGPGRGLPHLHQQAPGPEERLRQGRRRSTSPPRRTCIFTATDCASSAPSGTRSSNSSRSRTEQPRSSASCWPL